MTFREGDIVVPHNNSIPYVIFNICFDEAGEIDKLDFFCLDNNIIYENIRGHTLSSFKVLS